MRAVEKPKISWITTVLERTNNNNKNFNEYLPILNKIKQSTCVDVSNNGLERLGNQLLKSYCERIRA